MISFGGGLKCVSKGTQPRRRAGGKERERKNRGTASSGGGVVVGVDVVVVVGQVLERVGGEYREGERAHVRVSEKV